MTTIKLQDTSTIIGNRSRLEAYWKKNGFENFYTKFRTGMKLPMDYQTVDNVEKLIKLFHLNAVGFGNWVTQEDRFNYISALTIALYDIDKVIRFNSNVGLHGLVSFSFGARGKGGAVAHFEPHTFIINVTRYINEASDKESRFVYTGGAGSIAHEYGHAIDYFFGMYRESIPEIASISGGQSIRTRWTINNTALRSCMNDLLDAIIWQVPYSKHTNYYERLKANFSGDYMFRRNEIFARAFEKYVQVKLQKLGIINKFLNETKYMPTAYLTNTEMEKILPLFEKLIKTMVGKL